eukprot:TRINITY_DN6061_c0_g1::TRINITY_DN6061_c0_g1_i1::g.25634::m.25634 TRINITY_DN6061_c0_g1::TRINITY_DN6061_c0_g1_i1::g.25634  ORF type:complete len:195 (-),score=56.09,sp/Q9FVJ3/AGD12_ARATH/33.33/1e-09,C2/PF00168.25/2.8e-15,DOCK-C2/PF14429.1/0.0064 TRINITY_DN6061_c0_g1_i1:399-983(-)
MTSCFPCVPSYRTIYVTVERGHDLPIMDRSSSDPFVQIKIRRVDGTEVRLTYPGGFWPKKYKTAVIKSDLNPAWNETLAVQVPLPIDYGVSLELQAWDWDIESPPDFMGYVSVKLDQSNYDKSFTMPLQARNGEPKESVLKGTLTFSFSEDAPVRDVRDRRGSSRVPESSSGPSSSTSAPSTEEKQAFRPSNSA